LEEYFINTVEQLKQTSGKYARKMTSLLKQIKVEILALPDNPRIKRNEGNPHCFVISSKDIGKNWTPLYHDFRMQYQFIVEALDVSAPDKAYAKLREIINDEQVRITPAPAGAGASSFFGNSWVTHHLRLADNKSHTLKLHPEVVAHLRQIANMPPTNCPSCNGEREWAGDGIRATCFFCGMTV